jgi:hypothetical protein
MIRRFRFDGGSTPFEGRREVLWRQLPEGAEIRSARATVTPVGAGDPEPFVETLTFDGAQGTLGATRRAVAAPDGSSGWVEVDFHARRTLDSVSGPELGGASLLVDLGGVFNPVGRDGSLGGAGSFQLEDEAEDDFAPLPGLTVTRFRLVQVAGSPDVTKVKVRGVPAGIRLAVGDLPPFLVHPEELSTAVTSPDFASSLQAFLADAAVEQGFHVVPLVLNSQTLARLTVELEVDFAASRPSLPGGLDEVRLAYDFGTVPAEGAGLPPIRVPAGHRVCATRGRVVGAFEPGRVVFGPTGATAADPEIYAEVSSQVSQARRIELDEPLEADAVDLLLFAITRNVSLQLDLLEDLDGKPGASSLLGDPVPFELDRAGAGGSAAPTWTSVPLPREAELPVGGTWLVVQALEGTAGWSAAEEDAAMQQSEDGALSWRRSRVVGTRAAGFAVQTRLRSAAGGFRLPIELEVGGHRVGLERFEPLGRTEVALDVPEVLAAVDQAVADASPPRCPETEHLADGSFTRWVSLGDEPVEPAETPIGNGEMLNTGMVNEPPVVTWLEHRVPAEWAVVTGRVSPVGAGDLQQGVFVGDVLGEAEPGPTVLAQVAPAVGGCVYEVAFSAVASEPDAAVQITWHDAGCDVLRTDRVPIRPPSDESQPSDGQLLNENPYLVSDGQSWGEPDNQLNGSVVWQGPEISSLLHRARFTSPEGTAQAEVRIEVPGGTAAVLDISLRATCESLDNGDLRVVEEGVPVGWEPGTTAPEVVAGADATRLSNPSARPASLSQSLAAEPGRPFTIELEALPAAGTTATAGRLELTWLGANGGIVGEPTTLEISDLGFDRRSAAGTTPEEAVKARLDLTVAAESALEVREVGLRFGRTVEVPVILVAQTVGELTISGWEVVTEPIEPKAPDLPQTGLCTPAPPAGEHGKAGDCFCVCCGTSQHFQDPTDAVTEAGRPVQLGTCAGCGEPVVRFGGRPVAGAERLVSQPVSARGRADLASVLGAEEPARTSAEPGTATGTGEHSSESSDPATGLAGLWRRARRLMGREGSLFDQ